MSVIAVDNQKGGVGKTTLTFNLAKGFAARGKRTLVIDNDPQANLTGALLDTPGKLVANIIAIYEEQVQSLAPQQIDNHLYLIGADIHLAKIAERDFEVIYMHYPLTCRTFLRILMSESSVVCVVSDADDITPFLEATL